MKILFVHYRLPFPRNSGIDKVVYNLLRILQSQHAVTLLVPTGDETPSEDIAHVRSLCTKLICVHVDSSARQRSQSQMARLWRWVRLVLLARPMYTTTEFFPEVARALNQLTETQQFDVVHVSCSIGARYVKAIRGDAKVVLGPVDDLIEAASTNRRFAPTLKEKLVWRLRARARKHYEPKVFEACYRVYFFSQEDLDRLRKVTGTTADLHVLRVPSEFKDLTVSPSSGPTGSKMITFVGGLGSAFNVDAACFFCEDVLPLIRAEVPDAHFTIVGHRPPARIRKLGELPYVTVTGGVPNVLPYIQEAAVYVSPVRAGTGFKTKTVEALAMGKAIVATTAGVQGLWDLGKDTIQIADSPELFAKRVIEILQDDAFRREKEHQARALFDEVYAFDKVAPLTLAEFDELREGESRV